MADYGITLTGFVVKPEDAIIEDMETRARAKYGASVPLGNKTVLGQLIRIVAEVVGLVWELGQKIVASQDPDAAAGALLDALCALTGTFREAARHSLVDLTLTGDPTTIVPTGSQASTLSTGVPFETLEDATITELDAWADTTLYAVGDRVTNSARAYVCITAGTSAGSGGPDTTSDDITDGTAHWRYMGEGTGAVDVDAQSVETGALEATSGDITVIDTPVSGWSSVKNLLDASAGAAEQTDEDLRTTRELELAASGSSPPDAIRAELLQVEGVTSATVFYNDTDVTDGDGVPPHSVECLVQGGDDQDIFDTIFAAVAAGIGTYGTETGSAVDSEGVSHTVKFSRPTEITIYVDITLTYDASLYPSDGDDQVKAAIVAFGDAQKIGRDAVATQIGAQAYKVSGVIDVPRSGSLGGTLIKTTAGPTSDATIVITSRQLAVYDTSRIDVTSTPGTP